MLSYVKHNNVEKMRLLLESGEDPNHSDEKEDSLLIVAVYKQYYQMTELLIKHGANLNKRGKNGMSALHYAISQDRNTHIFDLLLRKGADPNIQDFYGKSPIFMAENDRLDNLRIILEAGADPNICDWENQTVLMDCTIEIAAILIEHRADVNLRCKKGRNALYYAIKRQNSDLALYLLNNAAEVIPEEILKERMIDLAYEKKINDDVFFGILQKTPDSEISAALIEKVINCGDSSFIYNFYLYKKNSIFAKIDKVNKDSIYAFLMKNICKESKKRDLLENKITELRFYPPQ